LHINLNLIKKIITTEGFYYTDNDIKANSFSAEEIVETEALQRIRNGSANFTMKESYSLFLGTCLTFCHKRAITAKEKEYLLIKQGLQLRVFIHDRGDEELIVARLDSSL
jgi:hypothetical protein